MGGLYPFQGMAFMPILPARRPFSFLPLTPGDIVAHQSRVVGCCSGCAGPAVLPGSAMRAFSLVFFLLATLVITRDWILDTAVISLVWYRYSADFSATDCYYDDILQGSLRLTLDS